MALNVVVEAACQVQIRNNFDNNATWTFANLDEYSTDKITLVDGVMTIQPGTFNFYFKFEFGNDTLYVGEQTKQNIKKYYNDGEKKFSPFLLIKTNIIVFFEIAFTKILNYILYNAKINIVLKN